MNNIEFPPWVFSNGFHNVSSPDASESFDEWLFCVPDIKVKIYKMLNEK